VKRESNGSAISLQWRSKSLRVRLGHHLPDEPVERRDPASRLRAAEDVRRPIVAAEAAQTPRSTTSRCSSAREKRESGRPCSRGNSQAIAFTRATSSGGKTQRTPRPWTIAKTLQPLLEEAFPPQRHRPQRAAQKVSGARNR
jgi:hypothetical protein